VGYEQKVGLDPIIYSATKLPFPDGSFEGVIASDVLEHIPPTDRQEYLEYHRSLRRVPPDWLVEHTQHLFPSADLFTEFQDKWMIESVGNESLRFHDWTNRMEMSRIRYYFFRLLLVLVPGLFERALRAFGREPFYRRIFVLTPRPDQGAPPGCP
jgi:hypothetical protein